MARVRFIEIIIEGPAKQRERGEMQRQRKTKRKEREKLVKGASEKVKKNMCEYFAQTDLIFYGRSL